jgi:transposase
MAYEKRYNERVLEYLWEGHSRIETARQYGIHRDTITRWKRIQKAGDSLETPKRNRPAKKLPPEALKAYVESQPDAYLSEIGEHFECTGDAVRKAMKKLNVTHKKRRSAIGSVMRSAGKPSKRP